jgi:hypothetical protein
MSSCKTLFAYGFVACICSLAIVALLYPLLSTSPPIQQGKQCELSTPSCRLNWQQSEFKIEFAPYPIPLEEEVRVWMHLPLDTILKSAHISGINMYMGKIPFIVESRSASHVDFIEQVQGVFFLGSCSEADMLWQMTIHLQDGSGESHSLYVNFSTHAGE